MVSLTMNLISGTHHSCEKREYVFMVLQEYTIISPLIDLLLPHSLSLSLPLSSQPQSLSPNFCLEQYSRSSFSHTLSVWTQPTTQPNPHAHRCQMPKPRQGSLFFISSTNPKEEVNSTPCLQLNHDFIT